MTKKRRKKAATTAARMKPQIEIVSSASTEYNCGLGNRQMVSKFDHNNISIDRIW